MIRPFGLLLLLLALGVVPAQAQSPLTLTDAISRARAQNPDGGRSAAAEREAAHRLTQARAGYLPRVDATESWQRSNQPVYVFSSLLSQRRFTAGDFGLPALNHPDAIDNFRAAVMVEQSIFDAGTRTNVAAARIGGEIAAATRSMVDHDLAASVAAAYGRVLAAEAARQSAAAAAEAAGADRERAGNRRDAGLVTDADVLQLDVFVARSREQQIRAVAEERTARAELNQLMGEPLGAVFALARGAAAPVLETTNLPALEAEAVISRPEVKLALLQGRLAAINLDAVRGARLPQVAAQGGVEVNGGAWNTRASSWVVGAVARVNLFRGFADQARVAEAREQITRRAMEQLKAETAARLDVYIAVARLEAARAAEAAGRAAVAQAHESRRIVRDRYENGLTDVAALLRATEAVVQAETQQVTAEIDVVTETAALQRALGRQ